MNENKMMEKPTKFISRRAMGLFTALCLVVGTAVSASAAGTTDTVTASDWQPVLDAITSQISVGTVVAVLAAVVGACVGFAFMWWGLRKAVGALMKAFKKGKVSV